ncbi:MAG: serine hydrolase domain-containing protein [Pseudomonadales bacterium]
MSILMRVVCLATWMLAPALSNAEDADLRAFVDGVMQSHLSDQRTIGATVSVVQDGQVLMAAGYGLADVATGAAVHPKNTLFRIGSISKVLVWMSVLQQVERAGASLDEDVANYLESVTLEQRFPAPVTLRHLMTHTPGFEDRLYGLFTDAPSRLPTLPEYLQRNVPAQVWLPGETVAYSNYGAALAGRIVENLSGVAFADYVQEAIFAPLGMGSTFSQQLSEDWQARLSQGYVVKRQRPVRQGIEFVAPAPAGAMSASSEDMASLMLELLNPATSAVLTSDAKALLLQQVRSAHPALNGVTLGLYEMTQGDGERALGHSGDTMLFHSRMVLWPEQHLGLFVSTNTAGGEAVVASLLKAFNARYQLLGRTSAAPVEANVDSLLGHYGTQRKEFSGPLKLASLLDQIHIAKDEGAGRLLVSGVLPTQVFEARGEHLFYSNDGLQRLHFTPGGQGPDLLMSSHAPTLSFARLPWFERNDLNALFIVLVLLVNLVVVLRLPYTAVMGHADRAGDGQDVSGSGLASMLAWLLAIAVLGVCALYVVAVPDVVSFMSGGYRALTQLTWSWPVISLGASGQLVLALGAWRRRHWWFGRRCFYGFAALTNVALAAWLYYWNLHPFSLPTL